MTGYRLEVGYNSAHQRAAVWTALKAEVDYVRTKPDLIVQEVRRVEWVTYSDEMLRDYAEAYRTAQDLTLTIDEGDEAVEREPCIRQLASGGGDGRDVKEILRRAFCRLVVTRMHARKMEVNLVVT